MNEEDVPQDPGAAYEGQLRRVTFAVGSDGGYKGVPSTGWDAEIGAHAVSTDRTNERIREAWEQVRAGEASPLAYHMTAALLDPLTLATEAGTCSWRVRRHLRPAGWARLSPAWKQTYARILGVAEPALDEVPAAPEQLG